MKKGELPKDIKKLLENEGTSIEEYMELIKAKKEHKERMKKLKPRFQKSMSENMILSFEGEI